MISMSLFVPGYDVYSVYLEDAAGNVLAYNLGVGATVDSPITAFTYKAVDGNTQYKVVVVPTVSATGTFDGTLTLTVPPPKSEIAPGGQPLYRLYSPTDERPRAHARPGRVRVARQQRLDPARAGRDWRIRKARRRPKRPIRVSPLQRHHETAPVDDGSERVQQADPVRAGNRRASGSARMRTRSAAPWRSTASQSTNGGTYHLWTSDYNEYTSLTAPGGGWVREGIGAFVVP
jgi:hypothetical protein